MEEKCISCQVAQDRACDECAIACDSKERFVEIGYDGQGNYSNACLHWECPRFCEHSPTE
jgi:hypothetical protein